MKLAVQIRTAFAAFLILFGGSEVFAKKKNPILEDMREAYRDVLDGNEKDLKNNKHLLEKYKGALKRHKHSPNADAEKQSRTIQLYISLIDLYTRLVAANETILGMFDGTSKSIQVEMAMEEVPKLEAAITRITKRKSKREWLTFGEVKQLQLKGWDFDTKDPERLPHLRKYWSKPKETNEVKRSTQTRRRTTTSAGE